MKKLLLILFSIMALNTYSQYGCGYDSVTMQPIYCPPTYYNYSTVVKVYNDLGQEVDINTMGLIFLVMSDGTIKKQISIE